MYMACAVVNLVSSSDAASLHIAADAASTKQPSNANLAQAALSLLPDMYVANLKGINDCITEEMTNVVFDDPGKDVVYGDGLSPASSRIVRRKKAYCAGLGRPAALPASSDPVQIWSATGASPQGSAGGNDGMWHPYQISQSPAHSITINGGDDWLPHSNHGSISIKDSASDIAPYFNDASSEVELESKSKSMSGMDAHSEVEMELDKYLAALGNSRSTSDYVVFKQKNRILPKFSPLVNEKVMASPPSARFYQYGSDGYRDTRFRAQLTTREVLAEKEPTAAPDAAGSTLDKTDSTSISHQDGAPDGDNDDKEDDFLTESNANDYVDALDDEDGHPSSTHPYTTDFLPFFPKNIVNDADYELDGASSNMLPPEQVEAISDFNDRLKKTNKFKQKAESNKPADHGSSKSACYTLVASATKFVIPGDNTQTDKINFIALPTSTIARYVVSTFADTAPTPTVNVPSLASLGAISVSLPTPSSKLLAVEPISAEFPTVTIDSDVLKTSNAPTFYLTDDTGPNDECEPGTFLCKSSTQFWVCGQFGDGNWAYGALRDVSQGLTCSEGTIDRLSISLGEKAPGTWIGADASKDAETESPSSPVADASPGHIHPRNDLAEYEKSDKAPAYKDWMSYRPGSSPWHSEYTWHGQVSGGCKRNECYTEKEAAGTKDDADTFFNATVGPEYDAQSSFLQTTDINVRDEEDMSIFPGINNEPVGPVSQDPTFVSKADTMASDTLMPFANSPARNKSCGRFRKRQDYGDDVQVPGFFYSEGDNGGNGIDGVGEAAIEMFGQSNDEEEPEINDTNKVESSNGEDHEDVARLDTNGDSEDDNDDDGIDDTADAEDDPDTTDANEEAVDDSEYTFQDADEKEDVAKEDMFDPTTVVVGEKELETTPSNVKATTKVAPPAEGRSGLILKRSGRLPSVADLLAQVQKKTFQAGETPVAYLPLLDGIGDRRRFFTLGGVVDIEPDVLRSALKGNNPERYDWGELNRKRSPASPQQSMPVLLDISAKQRQAIDPQTSTPRAIAASHASSTQTSIPKETILSDPDSLIPPGFDFSDGSNGGDGIEEDPVALFGEEPEDYGSQWGVDKKAQQNETAPVILNDPGPDQGKIASTSTEPIHTSGAILIPEEFAAEQASIPLSTTEKTGDIRRTQEPAPHMTKEMSVQTHPVGNPLKLHKTVTPLGIAPSTAASPIGQSPSAPSHEGFSSSKIYQGASSDDVVKDKADLADLRPLPLSSSAKGKSRPAPGTWDAPDTVALDHANAILQEEHFVGEPRVPKSSEGSIDKSPGLIDDIIEPNINGPGIILDAGAGAHGKNTDHSIHPIAKPAFATWNPNKPHVVGIIVDPSYTDEGTKDAAEAMFPSLAITKSDASSTDVGSDPDDYTHDDSLVDEDSGDKIELVSSIKNTMKIPVSIVNSTSVYRSTTLSSVSTAISSSSSAYVAEVHSSCTQAAWVDGVLKVQLAYNPCANNAPPTPTANIAASVLPYFFGPGPVLPFGADWKWPGPYNLHRTPSFIPAIPSTLQSSAILVGSSSTYGVSSATTDSVYRNENVVPVGVGSSISWPPPIPGFTSSWPPSLPGVTPSAMPLREKVLRRAIVHQDCKERVGRKSTHEDNQC